MRSKDFKIIQLSKIKVKELEAWTPVVHSAVPKKPLSILSIEKHQREIRVTHALYHS